MGGLRFLLLEAGAAVVAFAFYAGIYYVAGSERRRQMLSWTAIVLMAGFMLTAAAYGIAGWGGGGE